MTLFERMAPNTHPAVIPHNRLTFGSEEIEAVERVVASGHWAAGDEVRRLESSLMTVAGVRHCVTVGTGLGALRLSLLAAGVKPDDRVLVPAYSCVALANAVLVCGAVPVPVDVSEIDWNIDPEAVQRAAHSEDPSAIIAVNTFGAPAPVRELKQLGIPVIEDCAHGFGIEVAGERLGSRGDVAILSLYATKLMGAGEGGAVLTDQDGIAAFVAEWRDYADRAMSATRLNDKMTDITAVLARCQLDRLPSMLARRKAIAMGYDELLAASRRRGLKTPRASDERVWYRYVVELPQPVAEEISAASLLRGVALERPVEDWVEDSAQAINIARYAHRHLLSLPIYPSLAEVEQARVVDVLESELAKRQP